MIGVSNGSGPTQLPATADGKKLIDGLPLGLEVARGAGTTSATRDQHETAHRNVICSLLALEIVDYGTQSVFDQIRLTQDFRQLLSDATAPAAPHELVSALREDGALLVFLADPGECFTTALTIRDAILTQGRYRDLSLRLGINLGKAQIAEDEFGNPYVGGEGRQDADRLMRQGPPRQISVARQFVEVLSRTAPELAVLLEYQGVYSDTVGPLLCLYRLSPPHDSVLDNFPNQPAGIAAASRVHVFSRQPAAAPTALPAQSTAKSRHEWRRLWLGFALLPLLAGVAMATLSGRLSVEAPVTRSAAELAAATPQTTAPEASKPSPAPVARRAMIGSVVATPPTLRAHESTKAPLVQGPRSATLSLAVKPWGEVYVDGRKIGVTPPLKRFPLAPGLRLITITNSSLPTYQAQLAVDPGAQLTVAHDFVCISDREKTCREGFGKGLELHSRFRLETADAQR